MIIKLIGCILFLSLQFWAKAQKISIEGCISYDDNNNNNSNICTQCGEDFELNQQKNVCKYKKCSNSQYYDKYSNNVTDDKKCVAICSPLSWRNQETNLCQKQEKCSTQINAEINASFNSIKDIFVYQKKYYVAQSDQFFIYDKTDLSLIKALKFQQNDQFVINLNSEIFVISKNNQIIIWDLIKDERIYKLFDANKLLEVNAQTKILNMQNQYAFFYNAYDQNIIFQIVYNGINQNLRLSNILTINIAQQQIIIIDQVLFIQSLSSIFVYQLTFSNQDGNLNIQNNFLLQSEYRGQYFDILSTSQFKIYILAQDESIKLINLNNNQIQLFKGKIDNQNISKAKIFEGFNIDQKEYLIISTVNQLVCISIENDSQSLTITDDYIINFEIYHIQGQHSQVIAVYENFDLKIFDYNLNLKQFNQFDPIVYSVEKFFQNYFIVSQGFYIQIIDIFTIKLIQQYQQSYIKYTNNYDKLLILGNQCFTLYSSELLVIFNECKSDYQSLHQVGVTLQLNYDLKIIWKRQTITKLYLTIYQIDLRNQVIQKLYELNNIDCSQYQAIKRFSSQNDEINNRFYIEQIIIIDGGKNLKIYNLNLELIYQMVLNTIQYLNEYQFDFKRNITYQNSLVNFKEKSLNCSFYSQNYRYRLKNSLKFNNTDVDNFIGQYKNGIYKRTKEDLTIIRMFKDSVILLQKEESDMIILIDITQNKVISSIQFNSWLQIDYDEKKNIFYLISELTFIDRQSLDFTQVSLAYYKIVYAHYLDLVLVQIDEQSDYVQILNTAGQIQALRFSTRDYPNQQVKPKIIDFQYDFSSRSVLYFDQFGTIYLFSLDSRNPFYSYIQITEIMDQNIILSQTSFQYSNITNQIYLDKYVIDYDTLGWQYEPQTDYLIFKKYNNTLFRYSNKILKFELDVSGSTIQDISYNQISDILIIGLENSLIFYEKYQQSKNNNIYPHIHKFDNIQFQQFITDNLIITYDKQIIHLNIQDIQIVNTIQFNLTQQMTSYSLSKNQNYLVLGFSNGEVLSYNLINLTYFTFGIYLKSSLNSPINFIQFKTTNDTQSLVYVVSSNAILYQINILNNQIIEQIDLKTLVNEDPNLKLNKFLIDEANQRLISTNLILISFKKKIELFLIDDTNVSLTNQLKILGFHQSGIFENSYNLDFLQSDQKQSCNLLISSSGKSNIKHEITYIYPIKTLFESVDGVTLVDKQNQQNNIYLQIQGHELRNLFDYTMQKKDYQLIVSSKDIQNNILPLQNDTFSNLIQTSLQLANFNFDFQNFTDLLVNVTKNANIQQVIFQNISFNFQCFGSNQIVIANIEKVKESQGILAQAQGASSKFFYRINFFSQIKNQNSLFFLIKLSQEMTTV
ncbi:hypothetical protein ABPG73_008294 [Tetrahymena malaccensis]